MTSSSSPPTVILITGAGKGIGRAVVETLVARAAAFPRGLQLMLNSRTLSDLEALQHHARDTGVEFGLAACDLADQPTLPLETCLDKFGRIDALIHCAGVGRFKSFLEQTRDDLEFTLRTNVTATFLLLQKTYGRMQAQEPREGGLRGQIQVVTSIAAEQPFVRSSTYCLSKYAQRGLIDVMRLYGRRDGIRILDIKPGAAYTPMWGEVPPQQIERMMSAEDVAVPMIDALLLPARTTLESMTLRPLHGDL